MILADQLKSIDWKARGVQINGKLDVETVNRAVGSVLALLDPDAVFTSEDHGG